MFQAGHENEADKQFPHLLPCFASPVSLRFGLLAEASAATPGTMFVSERFQGKALINVWGWIASNSGEYLLTEIGI